MLKALLEQNKLVGGRRKPLTMEEKRKVRDEIRKILKGYGRRVDVDTPYDYDEIIISCNGSKIAGEVYEILLSKGYNVELKLFRDEVIVQL